MRNWPAASLVWDFLGHYSCILGADILFPDLDPCFQCRRRSQGHA